MNINEFIKKYNITLPQEISVQISQINTIGDITISTLLFLAQESGLSITEVMQQLGY